VNSEKTLDYTNRMYIMFSQNTRFCSFGWLMICVGDVHVWIAHLLQSCSRIL